MPRLNIKCSNCQLSEIRLKLVPGRGEIPASVLLMGEAPGKDEDRIGLSFVGRSGELLEVMIRKALDFSELSRPSMFITNTVLCRPTDHFGGDNRPPTPMEVIACRKNIMYIYNIVNPIATIFVGKEASKNYKKLFKPNFSIIHPAALLYRGGKVSPLYLPNVRKLSEILSKIDNMMKGI